ncbi:radical SAM protein [bacterium]|nr:MAG: radical SAM protein [bacterium]
MDLLLVSPCNKKKIYGNLNTDLAGQEPPLWAGLLAAFIREKGFSVGIIDASAENLSPEETAEMIGDAKPCLMGIIVSGTNPSASTMNMPGAGAILKVLKQTHPDITTLLGGLHPSSLPEKTLMEEDVDFVCQGEGFHTILNLLTALKAVAKPEEFAIKGLWYRKDGKIVSNQREELIENLDALAPVAWDLLPMTKYRAHNWHCFQDVEKRQPYAVIYTSLGCPYKCSFCCINSIFGKSGIRYRNPLRVADEIGLLVERYGVKNIKIMDEMFVLNEEHVNMICDFIKERGYDLNIWAYARVDTINERLLSKMKASGVNWLAFGIEAGSQKVRDGVSKGRFNQDAVYKSMEMTRGHGIYIGANYIFGLPDDDLDTMRETLDLAKDLNCEYANFYATMAFPGSKLYDDAVTQGFKLPDNWLGYSQYSAESQPLQTKHITGAEVLRFRDRAFDDYFSSKKYQDMILKKFGPKALEHIKEMLKVKITRKYA